MNPRAKGARSVLKCRKVLEKDGWMFDTVEKTGRFIKMKDLWNLFDAVAVKGKYYKFIQVKTNLKGQKWKTPFKEFSKSHGNKYVSIEIWIWFDRVGFEVIEL